MRKKPFFFDFGDSEVSWRYSRNLIHTLKQSKHTMYLLWDEYNELKLKVHSKRKSTERLTESSSSKGSIIFVTIYTHTVAFAEQDL